MPVDAVVPQETRVTAAPPTAQPPGTLRAAVLGSFAEAVLLVVGAVAWTVVLVTGGLDSPGAGVALIVLMLGLAAVLVLAARALRRGSRRARGPIVTWQLLQGATAVAVLQAPGGDGATTAGAVVALVVALGVVAGVVAPRTTDYLV